jgi:hypothetical protein
LGGIFVKDHMRAFIIASHIVIATALVAVPTFADARPKTKIVVTKRYTVTKKYTGTPGYGFLPGYEPPQITRGPKFGSHPWVRDSTYPWYGYPGYYRGRFNNGGFGPCYTKTPIGPIWNCG